MSRQHSQALSRAGWLGGWRLPRTCCWSCADSVRAAARMPACAARCPPAGWRRGSDGRRSPAAGSAGAAFAVAAVAGAICGAVSRGGVDDRSPTLLDCSVCARICSSASLDMLPRPGAAAAGGAGAAGPSLAPPAEACAREPRLVSVRERECVPTLRLLYALRLARGRRRSSVGVRTRGRVKRRASGVSSARVPTWPASSPPCPRTRQAAPSTGCSAGPRTSNTVRYVEEGWRTQRQVRPRVEHSAV